MIDCLITLGMILSGPKSLFYLYLSSQQESHGHKTEKRILEEISKKRDLKYFEVQIVKKRDEK